MLGFFTLIGVFTWSGLENNYIYEHYFLFAALYGNIFSHLIITAIVDHATKKRFSIIKNPIFLLNFTAMLLNAVAYKITSIGIPADKFLLILIIATGIIQTFIYTSWILDLTYILNIRVFRNKPKEQKPEVEELGSSSSEDLEQLNGSVAHLTEREKSAYL